MPARMEERDLDRLLSDFCDGTASPEQIAWLDEAIQRDDRTRQLYLEYLAMHGEIARTLAESSSANEAWRVDLPAVFAADSTPPTKTTRVSPNWSSALDWRTHPVRFFAATVVLTLWMWSVWSLALIPRDPAERIRAASPKATPVSARLVRMAGVDWSTGAQSMRPGAALPAGTVLALDQGVVELRFVSGAQVLLAGPAQFRLSGANAGQLHFGQLSAHVPPPARGFLIHANQATVTDLGTDFDLEVDQNDQLRLSVFTGRVELRPHGADAPAEARIVRAGESMELLPSGQLTPRQLRTDRLVKRPPAADATQLLAHYRLGEDDAAATIGGLAAEITRAGVGDRHLTRRGAPEYAEGLSSAQRLCMDFSTPDSAFVGPMRTDVADEWILDAWVRAESLEGVGIVVYHGDSYRNGYGIARMGDYWAGLFGGVDVVKFGAPVIVGQWTRLTLTRFKGATRLYVNGMQVGQLSRVAPLPPQGALMIGGNALVDGQAFGGQIDEVRFLKPAGVAEPTP